MQRHWREQPRVEWLVAGYLGYKPPSAIRTPQRPVWQAPQPSSTGPPGGREMHRAPPTGELQTLFTSLGGKPGKPAVLIM
jgi:hypothetical protein